MPRGGKRPGAGRPPLVAIKRRLTVTLSLIAIEAVDERRAPDEPFSTALDRILSTLPVLTPPPTG